MSKIMQGMFKEAREYRRAQAAAAEKPAELSEASITALAEEFTGQNLSLKPAIITITADMINFDYGFPFKEECKWPIFEVRCPVGKNSGPVMVGGGGGGPNSRDLSAGVTQGSAGGGGKGVADAARRFGVASDGTVPLSWAEATPTRNNCFCRSCQQIERVRRLKELHK